MAVKQDLQPGDSITYVTPGRSRTVVLQRTGAGQTFTVSTKTGGAWDDDMVVFHDGNGGESAARQLARRLAILFRDIETAAL